MKQPKRRMAFTTIELLVVIGIIAILAGMLFYGIGAIFGKKAAVETKTDLLDLATALEKFKAEHHVYPPSKVTVINNTATMKMTYPLDFRLITKIWPGIDFAQAFGPAGMGVSVATEIQGDQCLVLFLGGRHDSSGVQGFSANPANPFAAGGERRPPWFTKFKANRLYQRDTSKPFFSYGDGWFKEARGGIEQFSCYAYFAPRGTAANQNANEYDATDCNKMVDANTNTPQPFRDLNTKNAAGNLWVHPRSFQLMSPGPDMLWGGATLWPASIGGSDIPANTPSMDNLTNFSNGPLGS